MEGEELKRHLFKLLPKSLLASIPDNISDNDPELIDKIQSIYNSWIDEYKTQFPGTDISSLDIEAIKELKHKLTEFSPILLSRAERIKVNRLLKFLEEQEKSISKSLKPPKELTFEGLFRDKDNAKKVKEIFEIKGYTIDNKWQGLSENVSELLAAYYVLKPLLKIPIKDTPTARMFYNEFGLPEDYIADRTLRNELLTFNDTRKEFERIFEVLLRPKK